MLLRFGKLHCLGEDLMLVERLTQNVQVEPQAVQQWSRRVQGIGFKRLVQVGVPREPEVDFDCRSFERSGSEIAPCFADLCCVARYLHDRQLTNQPHLRLQTSGGCFTMHVRDDGWISACYPGTCQQGLDIPPLELQQHLQLLAERHALQLVWQAHGRNLQVWSQQAPPQRLHRLLQPVARKLRGWQLLWLHQDEDTVRVQAWQAELAEPSGHDPAWLIASAVQQNLSQAAVRVEWQQESLLLEFTQPDRVQLFARAQPVYEGQIRL